MSPVDPLRDVPEVPKVPRSWGLGALFENSLIRFLVSTFNALKEGVADLFRFMLESVMERFERALMPYAVPVLDEILASPELPDELRASLEKTREAAHPIGILTLGGAAVALLMFVVPAALAGLAGRLRNWSFEKFKPGLLTPDMLQRGYWIDPKHAAVKRSNLLRHGLDDAQIALLDDVLGIRPDVRDLLTLWNRKEIGDTELSTRLHQIGVVATTVDEYRKLARQIPGPADLVRFALREAWRDDVVQKWGYDQAWVSEFGEAMDKQGFDPEWARLYWRSHWMVPTPGQGFEMMWREIIGPEELRDLLKINDLAPGWIENVMKLARPVPGRIDRRYAYREGEISEEELFTLWKSDGYDDNWARIMTNTTISMAISETKGLTRSAIEKAYRLRRIGREEALIMMDDLKIQRPIAEFYLDQADHDRDDDLLDVRIDAVEKQFKNQIISEADAWDQLGALGVGGDEITARLDVWRTSIRVATKRPTKADLAAWFKQGTIGPPEYRDRMGLLNYPAADVDLFLSSLAIQRQEIAEAEERAARAEQERIRTARIKDDYQVDKALLDKDIAEVNAAIAGAQVALVEAQAERDRQLGQAVSVFEADALEAEYRPQFLEADAAIDAARLRVAELQTAISERRVDLQVIEQSLAANVDVTARTGLQTERLGIDTELSRLQRQIAGRRTEIARLEAELMSTEISERIPEIMEMIPAVKVAIRELEETQAERSIRLEEIDEALLVTLSAERRAGLVDDRETLDLEIRGLEAEIAQLRETIREVQIERNELADELEAELTALPGRADQVAIRLKFDQTIAEIQRKIRILRANVADLRIARAALAVEYRQAGG